MQDTRQLQLKDKQTISKIFIVYLELMYVLT